MTITSLPSAHTDGTGQPTSAIASDATPEQPAPVFVPDAVHDFTRNRRTLRMQIATVRDEKNGGHILVFDDPKRSRRIDDVRGCLVRIHSQCFYGEVLGSDSCDCDAELRLALDLIFQVGAGVLVYLHQEGRGAGLLAKAHGYAHSQREQVDSYASYAAMGLPYDSRDYRAALDILATLPLHRVHLMSNNPRKEQAFIERGFQVSPVRLWTKPKSDGAANYLESKRSGRSYGSDGWSPDHGLLPSAVWTWMTGYKWIAIGSAGLVSGLAIWWFARDAVCAMAIAAIAPLVVERMWLRRGHPVSTWYLARRDIRRADRRARKAEQS
ncbi:hypothetical protein [Nocardia huaxiensis]|nr:hypothetical protein [Nocardia huaxiensis]UFS99913.1 hypothetical protein LPY97_09865 [Nocardia huaxiensis]